MRALLLAACLLAATANAQIAPQLVTIDMAQPSDGALYPGESTDVLVQVSRTCGNAVTVLPAGTMEVKARSATGLLLVTGPTSVAMTQQVCAQETRRVYEFRYNATARSDVGQNFTGYAEELEFTAMARSTDPASPSSPVAEASAVVQVLALPETGAKAHVDEKSSPGAGALLLAGLGAAAAAVRRRR